MIIIQYLIKITFSMYMIDPISTCLLLILFPFTLIAQLANVCRFITYKYSSFIAKVYILSGIIYLVACCNITQRNRTGLIFKYIKSLKTPLGPCPGELICIIKGQNDF